MTQRKPDSIYPTDRAKAGEKTRKREAARAAGLKTFPWNCARHGLGPHGTAGNGTCRACDAKTRSIEHIRQRVRAEVLRELQDTTEQTTDTKETN